MVGMIFLQADRSADAQNVQLEMQQLRASDFLAGGGNGFGKSVAIWRDYLVVGAPDDSTIRTSAGAVYVFQFENGEWVERAKLLGSATFSDDRLGWSVAIDGDVIVAGAPHFTTTGSGLHAAAYVFRRKDGGTPDDSTDDVWVEEERLVPAEQLWSDGFGGEVSVSGDVVVAGAAGSGIIVGAGRVYVFRINGDEWVEEATLVGSDTETLELFANSVSINRDTILVGASRLQGCPEKPMQKAGAAYLFRRDGGEWVQQAKLCSVDTDELDFFGYSVAVGRTGVIIGARNTDDAGIGAGSASVFRPLDTTWVEEVKLIGSDTTRLDGFGRSVALDAGFAVVGATGDDDACPDIWFCDSGSAYIFRHAGSGWKEQTKLLASDMFSSTFFGSTVSVSGAYAVVGAIFANAAYVYTLLGERLDLANFALLQNCYSDGQIGLTDRCRPIDFVLDERIDQDDFNEFLLRLQGP